MPPGKSGDDDDFGAMFDVLDLPRRGYLTVDQIQSFYQALFYKPLDDALVRYVLKCYGGSEGDSCSKQQFERVLLKLKEQSNLEESLHWDFISLDTDGHRLVSAKNCLLLARTASSDFSMARWQSWINSRHDPMSPISWAEFQTYLYVPFDSAATKYMGDDELDQEFQKLTDKEKAVVDQKYDEIKAVIEGDEDFANEFENARELHQTEVKTETGRLLNRWNFGGVEAIIYDDGTEMERPVVTTERKNAISVGDLLSALEVKYNMLRHIVLSEMAKTKAESESPGMAIGVGILEDYLHDMKKNEKSIRKLKKLDQFLMLPGAEIQHSFTALGVMGETADAYLEKWQKAEQRFNTLREDGRTTDEINRIYEKEIIHEMRGSTSNGELLIKLAKREDDEKTFMLNTLKGLPSNDREMERMRMYAALHIQCIRIEQYADFEDAAMYGCLAERNQNTDFDKYSPDQSRQEKLSTIFIDAGKTQNIGWYVPESAKPDASHSKDLGLVDSWLEITRLLSQKHSAEKKIMAHFLLNTKLESDLISIKNQNQKELQMMKRELMKQKEGWRETLFNKPSPSEKSQLRSRHHEILSTAVALYWENLKRSMNLSGNEVNKISNIVLARLQALQDAESQRILQEMKALDVSEIYNLRKEIYRLIRDELLENISALVLSPAKITAEEKALVDLILSKYDKLRLKIFENYLAQNQRKDDDSDYLDKLIVGERKNRLAGNHVKLSKLCKDTFKINYSLQEVMGPETSRYREVVSSYLEELQHSNIKRKFINEPPDLGNDPDSSKARGNLISELHLRYEDEVELVLEQLREANPAEKSFFIAAESAWQQWEILRSNLDEDFSKAALSMGLCERTKIGEGKIKLKQDNLRYVRLAQERLMDSKTLKTTSLDSTPSSNPVQSSLRRVLLCHAGDWERLYDLLSDESSEELREAAEVMTEDERTSRLAEIDSKRKQLDMRSEGWQEDRKDLLEEAAAIKYVMRMQSLKKLGGDEADVTPNDVHTSIMADLLEEHDKDGFKWFSMALEDPGSATQIKNKAIDESKYHTNIFNVLCKYEGQADDDEILQALEDKYDSLRDKLLAEALMRLMGEKAWKELSERERQARLFKLKMEERRLRREGKYDELAKLLGDAAANEERLRNLMGMSREEYERKLKERLDRRKKGMALDVLKEEEEPDSSEEEGNPLTDLSSRYELEKEALLRMLAGQGDRYLSEQERQKELARLRRELRKADREEKFGAAALVLGLAERNAEMEKRLQSDKKRQEELAKQRIAALKAKMKKGYLPMPEISEMDEKILRNGSKSELMDAVLAKLELLFEAERAWFVHILTSQKELKPDQTGIKDSNPAKLAPVKTGSALFERLHEIDVKLPNQVNVHEYRMPLIEASFFREALLCQEFTAVSPDKAQSKDFLDIKTVAVLQDVQDRKSQQLSEEMANMENEMLVEMQENLLNWAKTGISENIPTTLFTTPDEGDTLEKALDDKYDAILATLVANAAAQKKGEKKWNSMSKAERDQVVAEMTQKIKKLMAEGKTEEALKVLGEDFNDPNALLALFGINNDEEESRRLENEREKRKRQRIEEGMSEEEADRLMQEEVLSDEEALKKRRRNILDLLQYDLEAQKAALMKQLLEGDERLSEEKRRQLELARLRLQQRMMQRENDIHAVAQVMALSKLADDKLEAERKRQLELAHKRLEAHRKGKGIADDDVLPLKLPDGDDVNGLIEVIVRELESKHAQERSSLIQFLTVDTILGTDFRTKASQLDANSIKKQVEELSVQRRLWRNGDNLVKTAQEQMTILKEATALNVELMVKSGVATTEEKSHEELLATLQTRQMVESSHIIESLPEKNPAALRNIAQEQWRARNEHWLDNVAETLLQKSDLSDEEQEVIRALEDKYDAMKDKLIAEALMSQVGEKEWQKMSEQERQRKIMELKMQERKLRQEGKMDEAAALMSALIKNEEDAARILGEVKLSQKEELERRLERRRQLKEQREAAGLAVDDSTLDAEMEKIDEEEKEKRRNVLLLLEHNLDEEREAILAGLRRQDEVISLERKRQLELARLRRDQKLIAREDQFHAAAIIFNQAKRRDEVMAESMADARSRQLALAKERIATMKARKEEREAVMKLFDVDAVTEKFLALESEIIDSSLSAPERLFQEMDAKHLKERNELMLFLLSTEMDSKMRMEVSSMSDGQIKAEQEQIRKERKKWGEERLGDLIHGNEDESESKKRKKRDHIIRSIVEQNNAMKRYMILKLEAKKRSSGENADFTAIKNDASENWLASVQAYQASSTDALNALADKNDEFLDMITYSQRKAKIESWNDSISQVVMGILPPGQIEQVVREASTISSGSSDQRAIEETQKLMESLDQEMEEQKKELEKRKLVEDIDVNAELAKIQQRSDDKRKALSVDLERQKKKVEERLNARRARRDELEYKAHAATAMIFLAEQRLLDKKANQEEQKSKQKTMMEKRLEERRRKREEAKRLEEEQYANNQNTSTMLPPGGGMKREKTVIDFSMSNEEMGKIAEQMQKINKDVQERMMRNQEEHKKSIREKLRRKQEEKRSKVEKIMREQTIVIEKRDLEMQRQKTNLHERLQEIRTGKTKTMKEKGDQKVKDFENLINSEEAQGMSSHEKMQLVAKKMQDKFNEQKEEIKSRPTTSEANRLLTPRSAEEDDSSSSSLSPRRPSMITDEDRVNIMKRRTSNRKKRKQEEERRSSFVDEESQLQ